MEKWDLYTKYREKTGKEHIRGEKIPEGFYHLVVHVWIRNRKGEYLISQRSADRPAFPLMWECADGSVLKGENSIGGALREVKEEVGLDLEQKDGKLVFSKIRGSDVKYEGKMFNDIMDVWLFEYNGELQMGAATAAEVAACKWMTVSEIRNLYEDKKMVHTLDYFFCAMEADEPNYRSIIGKTVKGTVDRPQGINHLRYPEVVCPVNYGNVEDVSAGDGMEQDVLKV